MLKLSRNEPCWCGSGKKYKQCHMRQDLAEMRTRRHLTDRRRREVNIKTEAEIDGIRRASHVTRDILDALEE
ncbi:MAG: SEC-C domain-containing protein, partial [Anaerolineae bacterium]|nr:SEC-C domain-containing protein [Anaerolineae bacterium]